MFDQGWLELLGGQGVFNIISSNNKIDLSNLCNIKNLLFIILLTLILLVII